MPLRDAVARFRFEAQAASALGIADRLLLQDLERDVAPQPCIPRAVR